MRQRTTTQKLHEAISNNLLTVEKVHCSYKSSNRIDEIDRETFKENLDFLNESGCFIDCIDWHFDMSPSKKGEYIIDSGAKNPYSENIVTAYLRISDDWNVEDIERVLLFEEKQINETKYHEQPEQVFFKHKRHVKIAYHTLKSKDAIKHAMLGHRMMEEDGLIAVYNDKDAQSIPKTLNIDPSTVENVAYEDDKADGMGIFGKKVVISMKDGGELELSTVGIG